MKRFVKIPTAVFEMKLTPLQILVYAGIVSLKSKENYTIATATTIANRCNISRNSVYNALNALVEAGLVSKTKNIEKGQNKANSYKINNINGKFVKLEYSIFELNLLPSHFAVYVTIKSKCNHGNRAFPSLNQISALAHICIDTVVSAVRELVRKGLLLFKHYIRTCGCFGHNNYIVNETTACVTKIIIMKTTSEARTFKKVASLFLNKFRYSKFWATRLEPLKNYVRKKINDVYIYQRLSKLRV